MPEIGKGLTNSPLPTMQTPKIEHQMSPILPIITTETPEAIIRLSHLISSSRYLMSECRKSIRISTKPMKSVQKNSMIINHKTKD